MPTRHMLRLRARIMSIAMITAGLDKKGHREALLEAALREGGHSISIPRLSHICAGLEYDLQGREIYIAARKMFASYIERFEPANGMWLDIVTGHINRALIDVEVVQLARRRSFEISLHASSLRSLPPSPINRTQL